MSNPAVRSGRPHRLWGLYVKEWSRLKRNPAALMAVGLLILMAVLLTIEGKASARAAQAFRQPCLVVYNAEDALVSALKAHRQKGVPVRFSQVEYDLNLNARPAYRKGLVCAVEIGPELDQGGAQRRLVFRHAGNDMRQIHAVSNWVTNVANAGRFSVESVKLPEAAAGTPRSFDLGSSKSRAMVSAMLLFSAQFFVCCALMISLTAHEREKGILQALTMTPVGPGELLAAKLLFHLSLSLAASVAMTLVFAPAYLRFYPLWLVFCASSLGLMAVATLITSFSRNQTSASLMGFSYLMVVGIIFALSQSFPGFAALRTLMFEHHVISAYSIMFDTAARGWGAILLFFGHLSFLILLASMLLALAAWVWNRHGWRQV